MEALNAFFNGIGYLCKLVLIAVVFVYIMNGVFEAHRDYQPPLKVWAQQQE